MFEGLRSVSWRTVAQRTMVEVRDDGCSLALVLVGPNAARIVAGWVRAAPVVVALWSVGSYTATYGAIGGIIVTMLWFYVSSVAILIGAELNAVIEKERQAAAG